MVSPEAQAWHEGLRRFAQTAMGASGRVQSIEETRLAYWQARKAATDPGGVAITETYAGGCRAYWQDPEGCAMDRVVLYLHGGGFYIGSPASHERMVSHIARAVGCRALNLDYRLAPEHPFPAAVEDCVAAYRWLLGQGYEPGHIAISGDSAGGGLALSTLLSLKEQGVPQPAGALPLSAFTDFLITGKSMETNATSDLIAVGTPEEDFGPMRDRYLGEEDPQNPLASPLYGDYSGLAPIYLQVGSAERLLDDSRRVAKKAKDADVDLKFEAFPDMQHVFQSTAGRSPEADEAIGKIAEWLRPRLQLA